MENTTFAHSLLFQCEACERPIATSLTSAERALEKVDGASFKLSCECGWSNTLIGVNARRHWVITWPAGGLHDESEPLETVDEK